MFGYPILLGSTRCTNSCIISFFSQKVVRVSLIFSTLIDSKSLDFSVQLVFYFCLVFQKQVLSLIFQSKEVYFDISRAVIHKSDLVLFSALADCVFEVFRSECTSSSSLFSFTSDRFESLFGI